MAKKKDPRSKGPLRANLETLLSGRPFLFSFLVVLILFLAGYSIFVPYFQENDDVFKLFFAKGVGCGLAPSEYLGHSNILSGMLLSALYRSFPQVPWYGLYLVLPMAGGCWAFLAALFLGEWKALRTFFFLVLFLATDVFFLYQLEFAITPQLATQGGLFLLAALWRGAHEKHRIPVFLLAGALFLSAVCVRLDGFLLTVLISLPWLLFLAAGPRPRGGARPFLLFGGALAVLLGGAVLFSGHSYDKDPAWKEFLDFNRHIEWLKDYRDPVYNEKTRPYFEAVGWTRNDLELFRNFCYVDQECNTVEHYESLMGHFPRFTNEGKTGTVTSLGEIFLKDPFAKTFVLYLCLALLFVPVKKLRWIALNILWLLAVLLLLIYFYRCPQRIYLPCLAYLGRLAVFYTEGPLWSASREQGWEPLLWVRRSFLVLGLSLVPLTVLHYYQLDTFSEGLELGLHRDFQALAPKDDQLFVAWASTFRYEGTNAFDDFEAFRTFHIYPLAVFQRSPHGKAMLDRFGVQGNLFRAMVDDPRILLICGPEQVPLLTTYLWEKFGIRVEWETYFKGGFRVFRLHSADRQARPGKAPVSGKKPSSIVPSGGRSR